MGARLTAEEVQRRVTALPRDRRIAYVCVRGGWRAIYHVDGQKFRVHLGKTLPANVPRPRYPRWEFQCRPENLERYRQQGRAANTARKVHANQYVRRLA